MSSQDQNKSKGLFNRLRFLDQFGQPALFNIGGSDSFKTVLGVIWTVLLLVTLTGALFYYLFNYIQAKDPDISTQDLRLNEYPKIDLGENNFFASFVYRDKNKFTVIENFQITWFIVEAFEVSIQTDPNSPTSFPAVSRKQIPIVSCKDAGIDKKMYQGEKRIALHEDASCIKFKKGTTLEGGPGSNLFKYIEVIVRPCDETQAACKTFNIAPGALFSADANLRMASKKIRQVTLQFNFVEAGSQVDDSEKPIRLNINSNFELRMDVNQEKYRDFFFQKYSVRDVTGWFSNNEKSYPSLTLRGVNTETTFRDPGTKDISFESPSGVVTRSANYMRIRLQASNTKVIVTRNYTKLIDVFADVGGVAEIATFIIAVLYSWHNSIRLEQSLINHGILNTKDGEMVSEYNRGGFSYTELMSFGSLGCCRKKNSGRKQLYEKCKESLEDRLDILQFLKTQGNVGIIQAALMKPYQMKLIPFLLSRNPEQLEEKAKEAHDMTVENALEKLRKDDSQKSDITKLFDKWIVEHVDVKKVIDHHKAEGSQLLLGLERKSVSNKDVNIVSHKKKYIKASSVSKLPNGQSRPGSRGQKDGLPTQPIYLNQSRSSMMRSQKD